MLDKCKRSCNLCGDLVQQKDRIQPTSKNYRSRRPSTVFNPNAAYTTYIPWNRFSSNDDNNNFNKYLGYATEQIAKEELPSSINDWKSTTKETIKNTQTKGRIFC